MAKRSQLQLKRQSGPDRVVNTSLRGGRKAKLTPVVRPVRAADKRVRR